MSRALDGLRVIEYGDRSCALAGRVLADLGAQVILVEAPLNHAGSGVGRSIRHEAPFLAADLLSGEHQGLDESERGFAHLYFNANKSSVVLDLSEEAGRQDFINLIASADVLLETCLPQERVQLGLQPEAMSTVNPCLIHCSLTPFGLATPWRDRQANDLVAGAAGGLIQVSGSPQGVPMQGGAHPSYTMGSLAAASAVMIALHQRDLTDHRAGVHIDLSLQEATALAAMQTATPSHWQWHQRIPRRPGLSAAMACKDGKYVSLLVRPDRFTGFLAWADKVGIDHGMTPEDWRFARLDSPREGNPVPVTTLKLAAALTRDEFVAGALEADIICLPVLDFPDLEQQPQYQINEQFLTVDHDALGVALGFVRSPVDAMADGVDLRRAPLLGEHQNLLPSLQPKKTVGADHAQHRFIDADPKRALAGLRIVDFSWVLAGPIGTRLLASYGAEVIRVESATRPDSMRSQAGPDGKPHPDLGGLFNVVNAGKKSFSVDLSKPAGLELIKSLIASADAVVNNFRPGAMERMGLSYDVLKAIKPDIVLLNLPGAHRKGPWAQRPSMGNILMAASGFNMLTGFPDERPRGIGIAYPDFTSPHLLVATLLAALRQKAQTGSGQELHLTQLSAVLSLLGSQWMQYKATGIQPPRNANRDANYAPHGIYPTLLSEADAQISPPLDSWVAIAVRSDEQWRSLCDCMANPDLVHDQRFADHAARKAHEGELDDIVAAWTASQDKWVLSERLQAAGIAAAPVEHLQDMLTRDPQLPTHYQQIRQPTAPELDIPVDREAARWNGVAHDLQRAPAAGEHNQYVVQELLGLDDEAFVQLLADDVLS